MIEPVQRFTGKAAAYSTGRPTYPQGCLDQIVTKSGFSPDATVFDTGAGTGLFTQLLLNHFDHIHIVEPNDDMRAVAINRLSSGRVTAIKATAEQFPAEPQSVDLITAAQAFHWFDQTAAKTHWKSVLKPGGFAALVWNERTPSTPFATEFSDFLNRLTKFDPNNQPPFEGPDHEILAFFSEATIETTEHSTPLTERELVNLAVSRSYFPSPEHPEFPRLQSEVREIFANHQFNNSVELPYLCKLFIGSI